MPPVCFPGRRFAFSYGWLWPREAQCPSGRASKLLWCSKAGTAGKGSGRRRFGGALTAVGCLYFLPRIASSAWSCAGRLALALSTPFAQRQWVLTSVEGNPSLCAVPNTADAAGTAGGSTAPRGGNSASFWEQKSRFRARRQPAHSREAEASAPAGTSFQGTCRARWEVRKQLPSWQICQRPPSRRPTGRRGGSDCVRPHGAMLGGRGALCPLPSCGFTLLCSRVGGAVQSMVWDPTGERLAVIIRGQSCAAALLPAAFAPNLPFMGGGNSLGVGGPLFLAVTLPPCTKHPLAPPW